MSRSFCAGVMGILLAGAITTAAADVPPPLAPPALTPPAATAPAEAPELAPAPAASSPRIPESRPVLVIPGVTAPPRVRRLPPATSSPSADLATPRELPALDVPRDLPESAPREIPRVAPSASPFPPAVLESVPAARADSAPSLRSARPAQTPVAVQPRGTNPPPPPAPEPIRRPPGLFGRFFAPPTPAPRSAGAPRSGVTVEPRSDPAADAALQRRIERQVREAVGDRVRFYEVRVVDREVTVRARVTRFWQKRAVRRTLESLPGLSGYHTRVEVVE